MNVFGKAGWCAGLFSLLLAPRGLQSSVQVRGFWEASGDLGVCSLSLGDAGPGGSDPHLEEVRVTGQGPPG